jgi:hypothetical protein
VAGESGTRRNPRGQSAEAAYEFDPATSLIGRQAVGTGASALPPGRAATNGEVVFQASSSGSVCVGVCGGLQLRGATIDVVSGDVVNGLTEQAPDVL